MLKNIILILLLSVLSVSAEEITFKLSKSIPVKQQELSVSLSKAVRFKLIDPDGKTVFEKTSGKFTFVPKKSGFYRLRFEKQTVTFPVTAKMLNIVYWNCPRTVKYLTAKLIPRSKREQDLKYWENRGVIPLAWIPGVARKWKTWTAKMFFDEWTKENVAGFCLDELSGAPSHKHQMAEATAALKMLHEKRPESYMAAYTSGYNKTLIKETTPFVDVLMIECYLTGFQCYKKLNQVWEMVKECNAQKNSIISLGASCKWVTSKKEMCKQIVHTKQAAPEAPGIAFFGNDPRDSIWEYTDELIYKYYIMPVLTIKGNTVYNYGGMAARGIKVKCAEKNKVIELLDAGKSIAFKDKPEIISSDNYTLLPPKIEKPVKPFTPKDKVVQLLSSQSKLTLDKNPDGIVKDGYIELLKPVSGKGRLSFDLYCKRVTPYALITLEFKTKNGKAANLFKFTRTDYEISNKYGKATRGMRPQFSNIDKNGLPLNEILDCAIKSGKRYRIDLYCGVSNKIFLEISQYTDTGKLNTLLVSNLETNGEFKTNSIYLKLKTRKNTKNILKLDNGIISVENHISKKYFLKLEISNLTWSKI